MTTHERVYFSSDNEPVSVCELSIELGFINSDSILTFARNRGYCYFQMERAHYYVSQACAQALRAWKESSDEFRRLTGMSI